MKLLMIVLLMLSWTTAANAARNTTPDPMQYAEKISKLTAEGDSGDSSGWAGCNMDPNDYGDQILHIECQGTAELLVHGGHWTTADFSCSFAFEPNPRSDVDYLIDYESCHYE